MKLLHITVAIALLAFFAIAETLPFPESGCVTVSIPNEQFGKYYEIPHSKLSRQMVLSQKMIGTGWDPDLFARWGAEPTNTGTDGHDYADYTSQTYTEINVYPTEEQMADETVTLFLGSYAYSGSGSVELCLKTFECLNQNCGNADEPGNTCDTETGACTCKADVWKGDLCEIRQIEGKFDEPIVHKVVAQKSAVFHYTATEAAGEIQFSILRDAAIGPDVVVRGRRDFLPTDEEFDVELYQSGFVRSNVLRVERQYAPGEWYFLVRSTVSYGQPFDITLRAVYFKCPNNCSGQGECLENASTKVFACKCADGYTALPDCSLHAHPLRVNATQDVIIPGGSSTLLNFNVEQRIEDVNVELQFKYNNNEECGQYCPEIYVVKTVSTETRASDARYTSRSTLPAPKDQSIPLSDHDLQHGGYTVSIYNPSFTPYSGKIGMFFIGHCPNNCSGHGSCSWDGHCVCHDGFHSSDCSITASICEDKLPAEAGWGGGAIALAVIIALAIGGVGGVFIFKFSTKKSPSTNTHPTTTADDQYAQLN